MNILSSIKKIEETKKNSPLNPLFLLGLFILGFLGISLVNYIVSLSIIRPLNNFLTEQFLSSINDIQVGAKETILSIIDGVNLFATYFITTIIFVMLILTNKDAKNWVNNNISKSAILEGICIGIMMLCCTFIYSLCIPHQGANNNQEGLQSSFSVMPLLSFFSIVIFAPICEELTYRAGLFGFIAKKSRILAYILTIIVFAFIHFDFEANDLINELINLPPYLIGAGFLCYAYDRKCNVVTSISAHLFYNGVQFILMVFQTFILK